MRWLILTVALVIGGARVARADDVLFYWVDKKGTVHATQNLDEVPEPYKGMYVARLKELEEDKKKQAAVAQPAQPAPSYTPSPVAQQNQGIAERELARQKQWRGEVAKWRTELRVATEDLNRIQTELDNTTVNPILRTTPQVQAQIGPLEEQRARAQKRVEIARKQLAEDIPARAKKESVPPRWLD